MKNEAVLELFYLTQKLIPNPEQAIQPFLADSYDLRIGSANSHSILTVNNI